MLTANQLEMMRHATSHPGRNYYCVEVGTPDDEDWRQLVVAGLAQSGRIINDGRDVYYHLTDAGKAALAPQPEARR
jgi:hypothetical protein